ncbi:hypothetical protein D7W82_17195 [Corallococcus sp. CA049B]|nr:hypothetical protein D7W82_17195 [Corallococcus sp. CA049B]
MERLRANARGGHVRRLYVFKLDRLTRSGIRDTFEVIEELRGAEVHGGAGRGGRPGVRSRLSGAVSEVDYRPPCSPQLLGGPSSSRTTPPFRDSHARNRKAPPTAARCKRESVFRSSDRDALKSQPDQLLHVGHWALGHHLAGPHVGERPRLPSLA